MASSLSTLSENLLTPGFEKLRETAKHFNAKDLLLVTRKSVYSYEYTDGWNKLEQTHLPEKADFYSALTESHIQEGDYEHAKTVWSHFECKTLGEYSDLYLKIDVLLLADVCLTTYCLDPSFYYTAPGFSFDCMLKYTRVKLELLTEYDMLLMIEKGIGGGLIQASNNLYSWAMSQHMPYGGFKWVEPKLEGLNDLNDTSPIGRIYEVDITYLKELHDKYNDLPFLPPNSWQHFTNGLIVEKVHRVLQFNQSPWLAPYIALNTEMRKKAANDFEKDFFKLLNNAVFGKTMESMRKRIKIELVSSDRRLQKLINQSTFKHCFVVLEISKYLMYDYHYNVMQKHYDDKIELMYTDTNSLVYYIQTDDFYNDLLNNLNLLNRMDTANLPRDHPCYIDERKKIPGLFSDETDGQDKEKIKAKGIRGHVVRNHVTIQDHKRYLFGDTSLEVTTSKVSIRSFKHKLKTIKSNKLTYNSFHDNRVILEDKVHTLAHGHYSIEEELEEKLDS
ncbi:hypothetical protein AGLY_015823 [Aphis glycines]|uniref:DNA-directed DNA polymerase n=1 Tax=Aphis glycines TaxID=307491 RepID=A0A6G0SZG3_APHGL|nr:hypothetical protein AGLY_015823 [Aphis glycines]